MARLQIKIMLDLSRMTLNEVFNVIRKRIIRNLG